MFTLHKRSNSTTSYDRPTAKNKNKKRYPGCLAHVVGGMFCSVVANRRQPNLYVIGREGGAFWPRRRVIVLLADGVFVNRVVRSLLLNIVSCGMIDGGSHFRNLRSKGPSLRVTCLDNIRRRTTGKCPAHKIRGRNPVHDVAERLPLLLLIPLEPQSRFGDKRLEI